MQKTSALYNQIVATEPHWFEVSLAIGTNGETTASAMSGDKGYREDMLMSIETSGGLFSDNTPSIGNAISAEIDVSMLVPNITIPRMAMMVPYIRATDGTNTSEWVQKGVYFVDTRSISDDGAGNEILTLHGYDAMLKADIDYDYSDVSETKSDITIVRDIANKMNIAVDERTVSRMDSNYQIPIPAGYTMREILGYIASMYAGNFIMSDEGALYLVGLGDIPVDTRYLITNDRDAITFGGVRILV